MRRGPWRRPSPRRGRRRCELADQSTNGRKRGSLHCVPSGKTRQPTILGKFCYFVKWSEKISSWSILDVHRNASTVHQTISLAKQARRRPPHYHSACHGHRKTFAGHRCHRDSHSRGRSMAPPFCAFARARGPPAHMQSTLPKFVGHDFALLTLPLLHPRVQKQATNDVQASR
jgi:hypothetical protein